MSLAAQFDPAPVRESEVRLRLLHQRLAMLDELIARLEAYRDAPAIGEPTERLEPPVPQLKSRSAVAGQ